MDKYSKVCAESLVFHETNDCAVKAVSISTETPYEKVHHLMEKYGRVYRKGTSKHIQFKVLNDLGYKPFRKINSSHHGWVSEGVVVESHREAFLNHYPKNYKTQHITLKQAEMFADTKGWKELAELSKRDDLAILIYINGHVAAYKDEKVQDWAAGKKSHIYRILIFKKEK